MQETTPEIFIDGERVDFTTGSLTKQGGNTASKLSFTIPGDSVTYRRYWNKEVLYYFDKSDSSPMFRGYIMNAEINSNFSINFMALDILGFLTGLDRAAVPLTEDNNVDGMSIGSALKKMIDIAQLQAKIGTDFLGDTNPVALMPILRGRTMILDTIVGQLNGVYNVDNVKLPRRNFLKVIDDGSKGQLIFDLESNLETSVPIYTFDYTSNIINFSVQNRKIPTIITVQGKNSSAIFKHESASTALGDNSFYVTKNDLTSKAQCMDFAQKIFNINVQNKYEYTFNSTEGVYLEENDVVRIIDDDTDINGLFRIIGKTISFGNGSHQIALEINKQAPLLDSFLA